MRKQVMREQTRFGAAVVAVAGIVMAVVGGTALAASAAEYPAAVSNIRIQAPENGGQYSVNDSVRFDADWALPAGAVAHEGDSFSVTVPDELSGFASSFPLPDQANPDQSVGTCQVSGKVITCTLNASVEGKTNVRGSLWAKGYAVAKTDGSTVKFRVNGQDVEVEVPGGGIIASTTPSVTAKYGWQNADGTAGWRVALSGEELSSSVPAGSVFTDALPSSQKVDTLSDVYAAPAGADLSANRDYAEGARVLGQESDADSVKLTYKGGATPGTMYYAEFTTKVTAKVGDLVRNSLIVNGREISAEMKWTSTGGGDGSGENTPTPEPTPTDTPTETPTPEPTPTDTPTETPTPEPTPTDTPTETPTPEPTPTDTPTTPSTPTVTPSVPTTPTPSETTPGTTVPQTPGATTPAPHGPAAATGGTPLASTGGHVAITALGLGLVLAIAGAAVAVAYSRDMKKAKA